MNKKKAIQAMLDGKKVKHRTWKSKGDYLEWCEEKGCIDKDTGFQWTPADMDNIGWELYEEPAKEEAPESIDIEVELNEVNADNRHFIDMHCADMLIGSVIGRSMERHGTRYFATWYVINGEIWKDPNKYSPISDFPTFASHVRFVRENLLGGIPDA